MTRQTLEKRLDLAVAGLLKEANDWRCMRCGGEFRHRKHSLHWSHLWGRRSRATRWHPLGATTHCAACHDALTRSPDLMAHWRRQFLGDEHERMERRAKSVAKYATVTLEDMLAHYQNEIDRVQRERENGTRGCLSVQSFD